ncbi:MAG: aminotransferase class III-fold pyridoxal phosphate-dependent enzyme [Lewinellaceae bacterium]|nr:aminotransferase class III-fold pyridoxal phosphate-dependent enzyme [Lewinellaceae bacterium]
MPPIQSLRFPVEQAEKVALALYGLSARAYALPGEVDFTYHLKADSGVEYTLKISRPDLDPVNWEMQNAVMLHLAGKALPLQLPRPLPDQAGAFIPTIPDEEGRIRYVRLLTWVPGKVWAKANPITSPTLESLGAALGQVSGALQDFDHPATHRFYRWNISEMLWTEDYLDHLPAGPQREMADYFIRGFRETVVPALPEMRRSVHYQDANDYNILVRSSREGHPADWHYAVSGFIDFGDTIYTHTINELACGCAYAIMDRKDPLADAAAMVRGFHGVFPLTDKEVEVLYHMIAARLVISVVTSAINKQKEPDNAYLLISERPAWDLLEKWRQIHPALAHYTFRAACGWEPCPKVAAFEQWAAGKRKGGAMKVVETNQLPIRVDLSIGSKDLGHNTRFDEIGAFHRTIDELRQGRVAIGGYGEVRPFYTTDIYAVTTDSGPAWRTVHLGLDVWADAGTPVFCPVDGEVYSVHNNAGEKNYGPTIILRHNPADGPEFYTLYGHLALTSLHGVKAGQKVRKGQTIAAIGPAPENGNWPPHLHFQVMLDMLGEQTDFPGVAFPEKRGVWMSICPDPGLLLEASWRQAGADQLEDRDIIQYRKAHLGKSLSLSYRQPLHMVRGYGQYLYDHSGRRYLDTVNNVPHVGHQHPRIFRALTRQAALLNTNTRYLHEEITGFAEELLALFPKELCVVHFVNSGSEANELALRMARTYTGQKDMVVLQWGYHGNTNACVEHSAYKFDRKGGKGAPDFVHAAPMPDCFRGKYRGNPKAVGHLYAEEVRDLIGRVEAAGKKIAGFLGESILSCGGQVELPPNYLKKVYGYVRAAGGVCIADEVQTGFGRVGDTWWAFQTQGVVPDIVTLGKPIGNGHPLGAVVCSRPVADAFANGMEYFNTFGGNPVSCAVGREVLRVIRDEKLMNHATAVGIYLTRAFKQLKEKYPIIGEFRGNGLFLGAELIRDPDTLEPATAEATYLVNRLRETGILASQDGPDDNVIKIKPPMCFSLEDADFFLEAFEQVLAEDFMRQ